MKEKEERGNFAPVPKKVRNVKESIFSHHGNKFSKIPYICAHEGMEKRLGFESF